MDAAKHMGTPFGRVKILGTLFFPVPERDGKFITYVFG